jgi:hypothetical protein
MSSEEKKNALLKKREISYNDLLECALSELDADRVTVEEIWDAVYDVMASINNNYILEVYDGHGFPHINVILLEVQQDLARELIRGCLYDDIIKQVTLVELVRIGKHKFKRIKENNKFIAVESL